MVKKKGKSLVVKGKRARDAAGSLHGKDHAGWHRFRRKPGHGTGKHGDAARAAGGSTLREKVRGAKRATKRKSRR